MSQGSMKNTVAESLLSGVGGMSSNWVEKCHI